MFSYEITILDDDILEVKIINEGNNQYPLNLTFPKRSPNYFDKEVDFSSKIFDLSYSFNEERTSLLLKDDKVEINQTFDYIFYKVKVETFDEEEFLPSSTFVVSERYKILNFSTFLAYFEDKASLIYLINYDKITILSESILALYESPVCIGCISTNNTINDADLLIEFTQSNIIKPKQFQKYVDESLKTFDDFDFTEKWESKRMIFIIDSLNENTGAIAHKNNIVFYFNDQDKFIIQKTIIHEILHWAYPNIGKWLNESAAEYLAVKLMLKKGLINDDEFLSIFSKKIRRSDELEKYSLKNLYKNQTNLNKKENYKALYTKGALYAFLLDNLILKSFDFEYSLEDLLTHKTLLKDGNIKMNSLLDGFRKNYIEENRTISYNSFLTQIGILFEENKFVSIKQKQKIELQKVEEKIIIKDNANIEGLQINDILLRLDGKRKLEDIKEKLFSMSEKSSCFVVRRNNKKLKIKIENKESLIERQKFILSFFENRTQEQKENWEKYKKN